MQSLKKWQKYNNAEVTARKGKIMNSTNDNTVVETWLPIFPGFYGTLYEPNEEMDIQYVNDEREEQGKEPLDFDDFEFDYKGYQLEICKSFTSVIEDLLFDKGLVASMVYQKVNSPREYNFANDNVDIQVTLTSDNITAIMKAVKDNWGKWGEYLKEKYTSYDGFSSFYSNNTEDWNIRESLQDGHKLGAILQFLLLVDAGEEHDLDIYDDVTQDIHLSCSNYEELIKAA